MPKKTKEELARDQMLHAYRQQVSEEKLLADFNRFTYEKMYYFVEGTKLLPEYTRLVDEQAKRNQEYQQKVQSQGEAIINTAMAETVRAEADTNIPEQALTVVRDTGPDPDALNIPNAPESATP